MDGTSKRARVALVVGMAGAGITGLSAAALAADGQPDPTFADGAPAAFVPNSLSDDLRFGDLAVDGAATPSGGAVVVGDAPQSGEGRASSRPPSNSEALAIAKLTPAGEPDPTFGDDDGDGADGVVSVNYGGSPLAARVVDGSALVVTREGFQADTVQLLRTNQDGSEVARTTLSAPQGCVTAGAAALDAQGRPYVAWLCADATVVRRYDGTVVADRRLEDRSFRYLAGLAVLPDGHIVLADVSTDEGNHPRSSRVFVIPTEGEPEVIDLGEGVIVQDVRQAADGSVAVVSASPASYDVLVLKADGTVDEAQTRRLVVPAGLSDVPVSALPRPTGGVVVQTRTADAGYQDDVVLVGYLADGSLDTSFGDGGTYRYDAADDETLASGGFGFLAGRYGPLVSFSSGAVGVPVGVFAPPSARHSQRRVAKAPAAGSVVPPVLGFVKRTGSLPLPPPTTTTTTTTTPTTTTNPTTTTVPPTTTTTPPTTTTVPPTTTTVPPTTTTVPPTTTTVPPTTTTVPPTTTTVPTTTTTVPPTTTTVPPTTTTAPTTTTRPVTVTAPSSSTTPAPQPVVAAPTQTATVVAPPAKRLRYCMSRRSITVRLGRGVPKRVLQRVVRARVTVEGKEIAVVRGDRLRSQVVLRNLPYGRFTVRISLRTRGGRLIQDVRRYRTCRVGDSDRAPQTVAGVPVG